METFVVGVIDNKRAAAGNLQGVIERLSPVGYEFTQDGGSHTFTKLGRVESVITEMVPVCEDHGFDVEDFKMTEYRKSDGRERSRYEGGRIIRES